MPDKTNDFRQRCYELVQRVPAGKVTTYAAIAKALGSSACRAVGSAMANNRRLFVIPCHRVVRANGDIGEYALGREKKTSLLKAEGVAVCNGRITDLDQYLYHF
jgi:methylated-DNA-[protein]-cysteine S-methyltransferase